MNKPSGISVLPERWEQEREHLLDLIRKDYPAAILVHRIDKETSGLVLFALTDPAAVSLQTLFEQRRVQKRYEALIAGRPGWNETEVDAPLAIDADRHHRTRVSASGKPSVTRFTCLETFRGYSLIEAQPLSGRTHQIRAHLAHTGFPIVGDTLYGGIAQLCLSDFKRGYRSSGEERPLIDRVALHARDLTFVPPQLDPDTGATVSYTADLPQDFRATLAQLRKHA